MPSGAYRPRRASRSAFLICLSIVTFAAVTGALFLLLVPHESERTPSAPAQAGFDHAAAPGALTPGPVGDLNSLELFDYRINQRVTVRRGGANLRIENPAENRCLMKVTVTLQDGSVIYATDFIKPNYSIASDQLDQSLKKGVYQATAEIEAYDRVSRELLEKEKADVTITVE